MVINIGRTFTSNVTGFQYHLEGEAGGLVLLRPVQTYNERTSEGHLLQVSKESFLSGFTLV